MIVVILFCLHFPLFQQLKEDKKNTSRFVYIIAIASWYLHVGNFTKIISPKSIVISIHIFKS